MASTISRMSLAASLALTASLSPLSATAEEADPVTQPEPSVSEEAPLMQVQGSEDYPYPGPGFSNASFLYPLLDQRYLPDRGFERPVQTAFKRGDRTYLALSVLHGAPLVSVTADMRVLGIPEPVEMPVTVVANEYQTNYQSDDLIVENDAPYASGRVTVTATDALGVSETVDIPIVIDNMPPEFDLEGRSSAARLEDGAPLLLSGHLDGTGTGAHLYPGTLEYLDASGLPVSPVRTFDYDLATIGREVFEVIPGSFADVPLAVRDPGDDILARSMSVRLSVSARDDAGNEMVRAVTVPIVQAEATTTPGVSNVLFLPGIKGSRLYEDGGLCLPGGSPCSTKLWEPYGDLFVRDLFLDSEGTSIRNDIFVREGDVLDEVLGTAFYSSFIGSMDALKDSGEMADWAPVPYDWRLSVPDIVDTGTQVGDRIYYGAATSTPYIEQTLRSLAATSKTGKVTIIAHSNGGLVTKALMQRLEAEGASSLVDRIIFVGVPQDGAPQALGALLYGYDEGLPGHNLPNFLMSTRIAREFGSNSPMAYHLLPSAQYFADVQDLGHPIVAFNAEHLYAAERSAYGSLVNSEEELASFGTALEGGRTVPDANDLKHASVLNPGLMAYATDVHESLDAWTPPEGVEVYEIAGWGVDTVAGIELYEEPRFFGLLPGYMPQYRPIFVEDGDGVVPAPSALMMSESEHVKKYWLNLSFGEDGINHGNLFESSELLGFIRGVMYVLGVQSPAISSERPAVAELSKKLIFFLHSPLVLEIEDESGRDTGIDEHGNISEDIAGSLYGEFGDVKYIIAPAGGHYRLSMQGLAAGEFSLDIQEYENDSLIASTTIAGVPTNERTRAQMDIQNGAGTANTLEVDEDGDGSTDISITPIFNGIQIYQTAPDTNQESEQSSHHGGSISEMIAATVGRAEQDSLPVTRLANISLAATESRSSRRTSTTGIARTEPDTQRDTEPSVTPQEGHAPSRILAILYTFWHMLVSFFASLLINL